MTALRFDGRVALVTGAGRGLGRAYAELLAERGAAVVVNDAGVSVEGQVDADPLMPAETCAAAIRAKGGRAVANGESVATASGATAMVAQALAEFGRLDIVINNAGIGLSRPFEETSVADFTRVLDVHLHGTIRVTQAAWAPLRASGSGRIVNVTSSAVFGYPDCSAYGAAKGAILTLTRTLAVEGSPLGIAVNAVAPVAATRMSAGTGLDAERLAWLEKTLPAAAVAPVVAYLAHERCALRGEILSAGGGAVRRLLIGETDGILGEALTPERVADEIGRICDPSSFHPFATTEESVANAQRLEREHTNRR